MKDFLFQIALVLLGLVIGFVGQLISKKWRKILTLLLSLLLVGIGSFLAGAEWQTKSAASQLPITPAIASSPQPTQLSTATHVVAPSPSADPYSPLGNCSDDNPPPCIELRALSWDWIGERYYGQAERCRWPEVANLNRKPDGTYNIPLPDQFPIFVPPPAPAGTYRPRIRTTQGQFRFLPQCGPAASKPCEYSLDADILESPEGGYCKVAREVYGYCTSLVTQALMAANLNSLCSGSVALRLGTILAVPSVVR